MVVVVVVVVVVDCPEGSAATATAAADSGAGAGAARRVEEGGIYVFCSNVIWAHQWRIQRSMGIPLGYLKIRINHQAPQDVSAGVGVGCNANSCRVCIGLSAVPMPSSEGTASGVHPISDAIQP